MLLFLMIFILNVEIQRQTKSEDNFSYFTNNKCNCNFFNGSC